MRLTLRTLLAYLDGLLSPGDAEDLGKKIEESEYASSLIHRIRDVVRRQRLGAPSLSDRGPGLDPNTVAEYLDNTLASERVIDFEKVCLDSDIHLAEVASSHQILTLVLGEPAEVDPAARARMYRLPQGESPAPPVPTSTVHTTLDMPEEAPALPPDQGSRESSPAARKQRQKPTVPEYLREPRKKTPWFSMAAALLLALCVVGVVLMAFGQFEPGTVIGDMLVGWGWVSPSPDQELAHREVEGSAGASVEQPPAAAPDEPPDAPPTASEPPGQEPAAPPADETPPAEPEVEEPLPPTDPAEPKGPSDQPDRVQPAVPPEGDPSAAPPAPADATPPEATPPEAEPKEPPAPAPVLPPPPEPLGRFMSSDQVLLVNADGWFRVGANQMLTPRDVLVLPTYRPKIALTIGVTLEILGGARLELLGSTPNELPGIYLRHGRVVMMPLGKVGSRMRLAFGDRSGTIVFNDADTILAVEVGRLRMPGSNPELGPDRIVADMYAVTGNVTWEDAAGGNAQPVQISAAQRLSFDAQLTSAPIEAKLLPPWIESAPISALDRRASTAIAEALGTDRLARLELMEIAISRPQREVKWLAYRCLSYVGQFDDVVKALNDQDYKLIWSDYVDMLRAAVARDAETAAEVRATLEKQYPQQALGMYRMLWGYTDKDLAAGEDAALVRGLDDELLAVRVLSYWNLREITGQGAAYQPEQTAARRQQSVRRWRQRLDAKEIRYQTGPREPEPTEAPEPTEEPPPPGGN